MAEPPKNGVWKDVFLTEVDFSITIKSGAPILDGK